MDSKEFELAYKRMWSEYTDLVLKNASECQDSDFTTMALIEECKNANKHIIACIKRICELCPELQPGIVIEIISNDIPFLKLKR